MCDTGLKLHVEAMSRKTPAALAKGDAFIGHNVVDPTAEIGKGCKIGPNVSIGKFCKIGDGVRISNSVVLHRVHLNDYSRVNNSIVGWGSKVGSWTLIDNNCVIGEDVHVTVWLH